MQGLVEVDKAWTLPEPPGKCQVFVFGEDGASFLFVEYAQADDPDVTGQESVASSDVLD